VRISLFVSGCRASFFVAIAQVLWPMFWPEPHNVCDYFRSSLDPLELHAKPAASHWQKIAAVDLSL
jgi:hypothetical protein